MNDDAQEAALGLLGLSPTNAQITALLPSHIISSPSIPAKRKQRTVELEDLAIAQSLSQQIQVTNGAINIDNSIRCICGSTFDDGFSIACDVCERWCHAACFDIVEGGVPEEWRCWECDPRPVDKERAALLQKERMRVILENQQAQLVLQQQSPAPKGEGDKGKRKVSPSGEKKPKRTGAANTDGPKRRRRPSVLHTAPPAATTAATVNDDEVVDIEESWPQSYVHITEDIIASEETRQKLLRQAQKWRGVSALTPPEPSPVSPVCLPKDVATPPTSVRVVDSHSAVHPALSLATSHDIRPPVYAFHTAEPVATNHLISPHPSVLTPASSYVSDSLNSYSHIGLPKPFVHLVGPPLNLALDSRMAGNESRFVRNGCKPNAILRPILCESTSGNSLDEPLRFGVFALRDLKENEEVVLGWEWDDGNVVHTLPAIIEDPQVFNTTCLPNCRPEEVQHIRHQVANILHSLSSTFTTCACGSRAKDCAFTLMAAFVNGDIPVENSGQPSLTIAPSPIRRKLDLGPLLGRKRGFRTREKVPWSGGMGGLEICEEDGTFESDSTRPPKLTVSPASPLFQSPLQKDKGKRRASDQDMGEEPRSRCLGGCSATDPPPDSSTRPVRVDAMEASSINEPDLRPPDPPETSMDVDDDHDNPQSTAPPPEDQMPPKMRKKWIHRTLDELREKHIGVATHGDNGKSIGVNSSGPDRSVIPSLPSPAPLNPPTPPVAPPPSTSPSSDFARLTLISPMAGHLSFGIEAPPTSPPEHTWDPLQRVPLAPGLQPDVQAPSVSHPIIPDTPLSPPPSPPATETESPPPTSEDTHRISPAPVPPSPLTRPSVKEPPTGPPCPEQHPSQVIEPPILHDAPLSHLYRSGEILPLLDSTPVDSVASTPHFLPISLEPSNANSAASTPPARANIDLATVPDDRGHDGQHISSLRTNPETNPEPSQAAMDVDSHSMAVDAPSAPLAESSASPPMPQARLDVAPAVEPPPAPKVKLSLRDFALRKKKQRAVEERSKVVKVEEPPAEDGKKPEKVKVTEVKEPMVEEGSAPAPVLDVVMDIGKSAEPSEVSGSAPVQAPVLGPPVAENTKSGEEAKERLDTKASPKRRPVLGDIPQGYSQATSSAPSVFPLPRSTLPSVLPEPPNPPVLRPPPTPPTSHELPPPEIDTAPPKFPDLRLAPQPTAPQPISENKSVTGEEDAVSLGESSDDDRASKRTARAVPRNGSRPQMLPPYHDSRSLSPYTMPTRPRPSAPPVLPQRTTVAPLPRSMLLPPRPHFTTRSTRFSGKIEQMEPIVPMSGRPLRSSALPPPPQSSDSFSSGRQPISDAGRGSSWPVRSSGNDGPLRLRVGSGVDDLRVQSVPFGPSPPIQALRRSSAPFPPKDAALPTGPRSYGWPPSSSYAPSPTGASNWSTTAPTPYYSSSGLSSYNRSDPSRPPPMAPRAMRGDSVERTRKS